MTKWSRVTRLVPVAAVVLLACNGGGDPAQAQTQAQTAAVREKLGPVPATLDTATAARLSGAFRGAADRALPAVVQIAVTTRPDTRENAAGRQFELPFRIPGVPEDLDPQQRRGGRGTGSGVIFDERGYVLTNNHVVQNASTVRVVMVDGREYDAKVIGTDLQTDVAVAKIEPRNGEKFPVAQLGSSERLKVGDWVLALGSPLGLDFTVTAGIVSAKNRSLGIIDAPTQGTSLEAFIQTDAAINPGNSGGPLVDLLGNVVGINTAIQSPTGYFAGAGFAIPIDLAGKVAKDIIESGVVHRPRLGIEVSQVNEADAEVYKLPSVAGAEVASVQDGLPAARAGLKMGDVIVVMDGEPVRNNTEFMMKLAEHRPGDRVKLDYIRYGRAASATVQLGEFEVQRAPTVAAQPKADAQELLGFRAEALTAQFASASGLDPRQARGQVIVSGVDPYGPAYQVAGFIGGNQLVSINGEAVNSVRDVERVGAKLKSGETVSIAYRDRRDPNGPAKIINYRTRR